MATATDPDRAADRRRRTASFAASAATSSLWSGGITLAVLIVLGVVLYVAVERSLASSGTGPARGPMADQVTAAAHPIPTTCRRRASASAGRARARSRSSSDRGRPADRPPGPDPRTAPGPALRRIDAVKAGGRDVRARRPTTDGTRSGGDAGPGPDRRRPRAGSGERSSIQVVGDRTAEQRTLSVMLVVVLSSAGSSPSSSPSGRGRVRAAGRSSRSASRSSTSAGPAPPARVRGRRRARAAHAADRHPGQRRRPRAPPTEPVATVGTALDRHRRRGRPPDRDGRGPAAARALGLGRARARARAGGPRATSPPTARRRWPRPPRSAASRSSVDPDAGRDRPAIRPGSASS